MWYVSTKTQQKHRHHISKDAIPILNNEFFSGGPIPLPCLHNKSTRPPSLKSISFNLPLVLVNSASTVFPRATSAYTIGIFRLRFSGIHFDVPVNVV